MSGTVTIYFATRTGHVLGAVTRIAATEPKAPQASASPDDVLVRGVRDAKDVAFLVPAAELSTLVLAGHPTLPLRPREFHVPTGSSEPQPLPNLTVFDVPLTSNEVTVIVNNDVAAEEKVWVLVTGGALTAPRIAAGAIPQGGKSATLPLETLPPGEYHILALVRRHRPFADTQLIPPNPSGPPPIL